MAKKKTPLISQEDIMKFLDTSYHEILKGMGSVIPSIEDFANDYLSKHNDPRKAVQEMINTQLLKCTTSGFLAGLGGFIVLPVAIPANIASVLYVQMRMIACAAYMAGFDTKSDQVQTFVYACLAGVSVNNLAKQAGIKIGVKFAHKAVEKIPGKVLIKINQRVGIKLFTKFGEKGIINLGKLIPGVGGIVGGAFDFFETRIIADRAVAMFFDGDYSAGDKSPEDVIEDVEINKEDSSSQESTGNESITKDEKTISC